MAALATGVLVAACGSDNNGGGGGGGTKAKVLTPAQAKNAKGTVTYCIGGTLTGHREVVADFNKLGGAQAKILALSQDATEQRRQLIQRLQAKSPECDVMAMDTIWTAEFASQGWVYDVTPVIQARQSEFIPSTLETAKYDGKYWGVPNNSNAGFLYYLKSATKQVPATWQDVYNLARKTNGIVYQGSRYEGLMVDYLELLFSAGGSVLTPDSKSPAIDSQQARDALNFMVQGIKTGAAPKAVTTMNEESSRRYFEAKKASFLRNWPYVYITAQQSLKGQFGLAPLPPFKAGGKPAGVIGGYNLGVNIYSDNPGGALAFVDYYSSPAGQRTIAVRGSLPPVLDKTYDDPAVKKAMPFAPQLRQAIRQSKPRPISPVYQPIAEAIYTNVFDALNGRKSVDAAVKAMNDGIKKALATF